MQGLHLTADLSGCPAGAPVMTDAHALEQLCLRAVREAGLTPVGQLFHAFAQTAAPPTAGPGGVTGLVLLSESHLAVHTWPERGEVTLDVYVCNLGRDNGPQAQALLARLLQAFGPSAVRQQQLRRGAPPPEPC
ncbi:adenosylmethionine decarboxylase [Ideonella livida]|uniref:Adenosylmethionine decarboxylase n=1 Tax=Ideonella livida TaxID=2707176 RepID=A0A7C9PKZ1_9BURK|nr:adenosylmethionine decarboxylase [Ideonella livida]NDY93854.1 adenosylmethionine decarboxylase [Ideonella livida]